MPGIERSFSDFVSANFDVSALLSLSFFMGTKWLGPTINPLLKSDINRGIIEWLDCSLKTGKVLIHSFYNSPKCDGIQTP